MEAIRRIHHITAIVGDPNENLRFYRDVLGLRLIKQTVNFDDPGVYHLYFSNDDVTPGTVITFFPWTNGLVGRKGSGQVGRIAFRIPAGSMKSWKSHLAEQNIEVSMTELFGRKTLEFQDVHGLDLALVEGDRELADTRILGFHGAVLLSSHPEGTKDFLAQKLGLKLLDIDGDINHFETVGEEQHHIVIALPPMPNGRWGSGTVHHIAWSVPSEDVQRDWQKQLLDDGADVTEVKDRSYFRSIYMTDPGDVIMEFATDGPGFDVDEEKSKLGTELKLPEQYEHLRAEYEKSLPELNI
ncbi:VOC family protein [Salinicoccus bachuensis]|uniref:VOC family protein n=1 Tax=Salinicoccus bachuensis TaxID=3136731 RepID=A0ABZ3CHP3_9STAP